MRTKILARIELNLTTKQRDTLEMLYFNHGRSCGILADCRVASGKMKVALCNLPLVYAVNRVLERAAKPGSGL
jgi:hypothetical protein